MRSKPRGATVGHLLMIAVLSASPLEIASAIDRSGAGSSELQRDLRSVRSRVERAPRASSFDLKNLQRWLHGRRIDQTRNPRWQGLEIELRRLRAKADRATGRTGLAGALPQTSPLAVHAPIEKPRYLGGGHTRATATPTLPYFGQRLVALQRTVTAIERRLDQGDTTAAARLLETTQADLAKLRRVFDRAVAEDPNVLALEDQISALEDRLAGR